MYSANHIRINPITKEEILSKVSEYDIFKMYCENFKELNQSFKSSLYDDTNPSVRVFQKANNRLCYKDFGTGENYDCFSYIQRKWNLTFQECLNVIGNDIGLKANSISFKPQFLIGKENISKIENNVLKTIINPIKRNWKLIDYTYWNKYGISFDKLEEFNVFPCSCVYLTTKEGKQIVIKEKNNNPIYAYQFIKYKEYSYKIYRPLAEKRYKWLFSGGSKDYIEGIYQLPLYGKLLILTKSLKDCMCFSLFNYPAISLQGEVNKFEYQLVTKLLKKFEEIIVIYDNDEQGRKSAFSLQNEYKFRILFIDEAKDLSDLIKLKGLKDSEQIINKLINETKT